MHSAGNAARRVRLTTPQPWPALQQLAEALLVAINADLIRSAPHWLGHCKLLVETDRGSAYASLTGADEPISWRGTLTGPFGQIGLTAYGVVYGATDQAVAAAINRALADLVPHAEDWPLEAAADDATAIDLL